MKKLRVLMVAFVLVASGILAACGDTGTGDNVDDPTPTAELSGDTDGEGVEDTDTEMDTTEEADG